MALSDARSVRGEPDRAPRARRARGRAVAVEPRLATDNIAALLEAVRGGLGAAIMPRWFVREDLDAGTLVDVAPDLRAARLAVNLAVVAGARRPARVERMVEAMAAWAEETL